MDALILAGGRGSRLAPFPAPKCLLPINGVAMLDRLIEHVRPSVRSIVACTGYRAPDVEQFILRRWAGLVTTSFAGEDVPMLTRLMRARTDRRLNDRVLVLYGDELADVTVYDLLGTHLAHEATITFTGYQERLPFGVVKHGRISSDERVIVNIGFVVAEPRAFDHARPEDGVADWINRVASAGEPTAWYRHMGRRATVNSLADVAHAESMWP